MIAPTTIRNCMCLLSIPLLFAGCGGGGTESATPGNETVIAATVVRSSCTPSAPIKVQLFGDSTLYGYDSTVRGRAPVYPELALQRYMDLRFGPGVITIESRAVSGTTSSQLMAGTDGLNKAWPEPVSANIIVTNFGINDQMTGVPIETYRANLAKLSVPPVKILFLTPLPYWKVDTLQPTYADEMKSVAASLGAPVADANAMALATAAWSTKYAPDGAHPTSAGYQLINDKVLAPAVDSMVVALGCK